MDYEGKEWSDGEDEEEVYKGEQFEKMNLNEQEEHVKELWRHMFLKSVAASVILKVTSILHKRIINFGTTKNINKEREDLKLKLIEQKSMIVLLP
jgi:hypothetical protein